MKRAMLASIIGLMILYGCNQRPQTIKLRYDELGQITPAVRPGDTITWYGTSPTWVGQSPCEHDDSAPCKIKQKPHGRLYSYDCQNDRPCDPEIMVDEGTRDDDEPINLVGNPIRIQVFCDSGHSMIRTTDQTKKVKYEDVVHWVVVGDYSDPKMYDMKVNFDPRNTQMNVCSDDKQIDRMHDCTVRSSPTTAYYKVTIGSCTESAAGKLEP